MLRLPDNLSKAEKLQKVTYKLYISIECIYLLINNNVLDLVYMFCVLLLFRVWKNPWGIKGLLSQLHD